LEKRKYITGSCADSRGDMKKPPFPKKNVDGITIKILTYPNKSILMKWWLV